MDKTVRLSPLGVLSNTYPEIRKSEYKNIIVVKNDIRVEDENL